MQELLVLNRTHTSARPRERHPLRTLSLLMAGALVALVMLLGPTAHGDVPPRRHAALYIARADTDSVAVLRARLDSLRAQLAALSVDSVQEPRDALLADSLRARIDALLADPQWADLLLPDTLGSDSLLADSLLAQSDSLAPPDTNYRVQRYLSALWRDRRTASLFPRENRPLTTKPGQYWQHQVALDSAGTDYVAREQVGGKDVRYPLRVTRDQYQREKLTTSLTRNWRTIAEQRAQLRQQQQRGGLGVNITVPGGRQSAFTTIFGRNEVDLRVTGQADIRAGFNYRKSDQQITLGSGSQLDPDFKQDLRLGVNGTIGDKVHVGIDWDTNRDFDFQNRLKLDYTGYDDEILQRVEAGNVFLQTPSTLIRGGQSLFGIKTEWRIGDLHVTTVASQQEGQANSLSIDGGSETTTFNLRPTDYDERQHYFLGYYFRNRWEDALSDPPNLIVDGQFERINRIEVWKIPYNVGANEQNLRQVVAMVDLGESPDLVTQADAFTREELLNEDTDQYSQAEIDDILRPGDAAIDASEYLQSGAMEVPLTSDDFQIGQFKKLSPSEYTVDGTLGYISLNSKLNEQEALAVAIEYQRRDGSTYRIGTFSTETGGGDNSQTGDRLILKLLRPGGLKQPINPGDPSGTNPAAWYLEMRNIYPLGRGIQANEFELRIAHAPPGRSSSERLQGVSGQQTLIQLLGLDRLNEDGAPNPDNRFDFLTNYTILPGDGLLIFPYLEPFGNRIADVIESTNLSAEDKQEAREQFVFDDLYTLKQEKAELKTDRDVYLIEGSSRGSVQAFYDLRAYSGLIEGSVRVTSGGTPLREGADYHVDYQGGTVEITNPSYLVAGRDIEIEYEQNALLNLQKKTLLGARLQYGDQTNNDPLVLGSTLMRMSQRSLTDKFRLGEEPIANTIWGLDGNLNLEPRWLTRALDALPLLQTREQSAIRITGEFAQLLPGHTQTNAFKDSRRDLRRDNLDFREDELAGISYLDDFEGFENTFTLMRPGAWRLSSEPLTDGPGRLPTFRPVDERSVFGWYQLNESTLRQMGLSSSDVSPAISILAPQDIYPNRERTSQERTLTTFDVYFTPHERGPYNFNTDLGTFLDNPKTAWGGMMQRISEGFTDFTLKNIEFVEFIIKPFPENDQASPDAKLYLDLGLITEDVIPDNKLNTEDGLAVTEPSGNLSSFNARLPNGQPDQVINPIGNERITEDLGLDGLASFPNNAFENSRASEEVQFADFLESLNSATSARFPEHLAREIAKAQRDPSGDDYHHFLDRTFFENSAFFPGGAASVQERFSRYFSGFELNSLEGQRELSGASETSGNSQSPDTEDLNFNASLDNANDYYQYQLPLHRDSLDFLAQIDQVDDYVVGRVGENQDWYLVRIPIKDFDRCFGSLRQADTCVDDFTAMETIRLWTTGHEVPMTIRFATLELVGSQWRKSDAVSAETLPGGNTPLQPPVDTPVSPIDDARISIESVNSEENLTYGIPYGTVVSKIRQTTGGSRPAREQAMVLKAENLKPQQQLAVFQTYSSGQNLLKYSNLRMFVHLDGTMQGGLELTEEDRGKVKLFVRLGANETTDYYEYEQPLTPSPLPTPDGQDKQSYLWRTNEQGVDVNSMNIQLGVLNQLKFQRDEALGVAPDSIFWNDEHGVLEETVATFAPPGTRIGVRGTPSLARVTTIIIGVRNGTEETVLEKVNVWVNELRVSGYDEQSGIAALVNADIKLADLGQIKANFRTQTDGFGSLASTLDDRDQTTIRDWAVNTRLNMAKLIPERFGWTIPVTMEVKSNTTTPRYDPNRGDVRVEDLVDAIDASDAFEPDEQELRKQEIVEQAQTYTFTRTFTSNLQKNNSRSRLLRYTLDGLAFGYSYSDVDGRTPNQSIRDSWRWSTTLSYRFSNNRPRVFRPFGFLGDIPVLDLLAGLSFNYLPQSVNFSVDGARRLSETKERPRILQLDDDVIPLPQDIQFPLRTQHAFDHGRQFDLVYNPFRFLNLSLTTNTDQSLNAAGVDTLFTLIEYELDEDGNVVRDDQGQPIENRSGPSPTPWEIPEEEEGVTAFQSTSLRIRPTGDVLGDIFNGTDPGEPGLRTELYGSRLNVTFRPNLNALKALDWITIQDVRYSPQFNWRNGSFGSNTGATAGTTVDLGGGLSLRPQSLFQKFGFYRTIEEHQEAYEQEKQAERRRRDQERQARKEERRRAREERRLQREAERAAEEAAEEAARAAEEAGEPLPEEPEEAAQAAETPEPGDEQEQPAMTQERDVPPEQPPADDPAAVDSTDQGGFNIPFLPNPVVVLRQTFLAVTGVSDFTVTYTGRRSTESTNVGRPDGAGGVAVNYTLLDAFKGQGPSLGYRLGLDRSIDPNQRIIDDRLQVTDALTDSDRLQARTTINASNTLRINLNWSLEQSSQENVTYRREEGALFTTATSRGNNRASVWAFRADYLSLIQRQLDTFTADFNAADLESGIIDDANRDGRVALTNESIVDDFLATYLGGAGTLDGAGHLPFPMPNWTITYSGISNWPIIRRLTQSASLRHGYSADYDLDARDVLRSDSTDTFSLAGGYSVKYTVPNVEVGGIRVNQRYQPLIGVDLSFKGGVQTSIAWNTGNTYSLSTSNLTVIETTTSELAVTLNYQRQGLKLPFFRNRLNNRISFSLTLSHTANDDRSFFIHKTIKEAVILESGPGAFVPADALTEPYMNVTTSHSRFTVAPKISYQFSNRISMDAFLNYERFNGDSLRPSTTSMNGGFNFRLSISS